MRLWAMLACVAVAVLAVHPAHAETHVEVLATWPTGDSVTLHRRQTFYLHLHYTSDEPVQIWAEPYFHGEPANAGNNPSRIYPAGSGEALGWFFPEPGAQVDEVRISAGDGSPKGTRVVATYPVSVTADNDERSQTAPPPAWVTTLRAADKAAQDADYRKAMNAPISTGEELFFAGFMLAMFALGLVGLVWPAWGLWRWRGGWRLAAAVPMAILAFIVLRLLIGTAIDPTSHNLWPFEIVIWGGLSCIWMLLVGLARKFFRAGRAA